MAISFQRPDSATFVNSITNIVRFWLDDEDDVTPFTAVSGHPGRSGPHHTVLEAENLEEAAESLREWFTDRLTNHRKCSGPIDRLSSDLIRAALEQVDWLDLADEIRD